MLEIRQADATLVNELSVLCATSFSDAYHGVNSKADIRAYCEKNYSIKTIAENLSNPDVIYKMAYKGDKAVGYFMIQSEACPIPIGDNAIELKQIYLLASEFGTGLGRKLLDEVYQCARIADNLWVWLSVSDLNLRAQSFYLKNGFKALGAAPILEVGSDRLSATIMAREV